MFLRQEWDHNRWIQCGKEEETTVHMMKCSHLESANETWNEAQARLRDHLTAQKMLNYGYVSPDEMDKSSTLTHRAPEG